MNEKKTFYLLPELSRHNREERKKTNFLLEKKVFFSHFFRALSVRTISSKKNENILPHSL